MSRRAKITKRSFPVFYPYWPETAKLDNAVVWPTQAAVRRCVGSDVVAVAERS